jgi:hypothetical protein
MTNAEIDMAEAAILDILKAGAVLYPPLAGAVPGISALVQLGMQLVKAGLADGSLIPDGQGGIVTKAWADDPRHALNPDGTFKN